MDNNGIRVDNKIITKKDLEDIFSKMNEELLTYQSQYEQEKIKNEKLEYNQQTWSLKDYEGSFVFEVDFYDSTSIKYDKYELFMDVFEKRISEIRHIYCHCKMIYGIYGPNTNNSFYSSRISMYIYENKIEFDFSLNSIDNKMVSIVDYIKNKIDNAPEKYDSIIKNKNSIMNKATLALGLIPSIIICTIMIFLPAIGDIIKNGYIVYPALCLMIGYCFGMFLNNKIQTLFRYILKEKKYVGYDVNSNRSIYKDDIEKFVSESEVMIGKNSKNLLYREEIKRLNEEYSKYLPTEIVIITIITLIIIVLYNLIGL